MFVWQEKVALFGIVWYVLSIMIDQISVEQLIGTRKRAEESVADMADGELKRLTYQTILDNLVRQLLSESTGNAGRKTVVRPNSRAGSKPGGTTSRILALIDDGFFVQPRTLGDLRQALAEKGFHYRFEDLGTPLTRIVRRKELRRTQTIVSGKKVWRYSNY